MPSRRAIVRISGTATAELLSQLFVDDGDRMLLDAKVPQAAQVNAQLSWPGRSISLMAYYWPTSRSFTGEPSAELHLLGSLPLVESLVSRLCQLGARHAERGEFSLRSFLAGKVDLVQAEAVLSVIEAEGEAELQTALGQLGGNISRPIRAMREKLIELVANLEAGLDFVEEDIEFVSLDEMYRQLQAIDEQIHQLLQQLSSRDARTRNPQVVIIGLPNAGKSTLFNCLLQTERAIVSELAGTTRDIVSQSLQLGDYAFDLIDTAGIEELHDDTPRAAAQAALQVRLRRSDLALLCVDVSLPFDRLWWKTQLQYLSDLGLSILCVGTKGDQPMNADCVEHLECVVSCKNGTGIQDLRRSIIDVLKTHRRELQSESLQRTSLRCRRSLESAKMAISAAIDLTQQDNNEDLIAAELRMALDELASIIGEVHSDDILGEIFRRFCIGK
jgi:tRNA modification GTPase